MNRLRGKLRLFNSQKDSVVPWCAAAHMLQPVGGVVTLRTCQEDKDNIIHSPGLQH